AIESDVTSLDPAATIEQESERTVALAIYDPLMSYENGKVVPFLAQRLVSSRDLKTWTLTLRPGVTFTDGTPLNAQAVIDHFQRLKAAPACGCAPAVAPIQSVTASDANTIVFRLASAQVAFGDLLAGPVGYVESPTAARQWGSTFSPHAVGTGAFKLTE